MIFYLYSVTLVCATHAIIRLTEPPLPLSVVYWFITALAWLYVFGEQRPRNP